MPLEREIILHNFNLWYAQQLVADIPVNQFTHQPLPNINPPAWILGHLTVSSDFTLQLLGQPKGCPDHWYKLFGPGTSNHPEEAFPRKDELWSGYFAAHQRVITAARNASADRLSAPNPLKIEFLSSNLPTIGDQVAHLMSIHEAMHLGQLSAWRRMMGMPGVMKL